MRRVLQRVQECDVLLSKIRQVTVADERQNIPKEAKDHLDGHRNVRIEEERKNNKEFDTERVERVEVSLLFIDNWLSQDKDSWPVKSVEPLN